METARAQLGFKRSSGWITIGAPGAPDTGMIESLSRNRGVVAATFRICRKAWIGLADRY